MSSVEKDKLFRQKTEKNIPREPVLSREVGTGTGFMKTSIRTVLWQRLIILSVISLLSSLIVAPKFSASIGNYHVGDIARLNVKSAEDILVEDIPSTMKKREKAMAESPVLYDYDRNTSMEIADKVRNAFGLMRQTLSAVNERAAQELKERSNWSHSNKDSGILEEIISAYLEESRHERRDAFNKALGSDISDDDFIVMEKKGFPSYMEKIIIDSAAAVSEKQIVDVKELILKEKDKGIAVRDINSREEKKITDFSKFISLSEARGKVINNISLLSEELSIEEMNAVAALAASLVKPTLTLNKNETEKRKDSVAAAVSPVYFHIKDGEMILREGERITNEHILKIRALAGRSEGRMKFILKLAGLFLIIAALLYAVCHFFIWNIRKKVIETTDLIFLGSLLVFSMLVLKFSLPVVESIREIFPHIQQEDYKYFFTAAASAMLVRIVLTSEAAITFSIVISIMAAMIMKNDVGFGIYTLIGSIVGAHAVGHCKYRTTLVKAGFYLGIVNALMVLPLLMMTGQISYEAVLFTVFIAFLGGLFTGIVVTGLTPVVETIFGYTTNFKLMELSSYDHPLLKELITQAPGTYHHSWIIGNLVESAAAAINANPLLARVSALYHDIGKLKKPQYFFENQKGNKNPHDKLAPSLSGLILIGHVKDGIELANRHKLGREITAIIPQHHGTRIIRFFYQKAKEREDPEVHSVHEKDFRYPGPKPQTKEAGLIMIADAVEAASRAIQDPKPAKIQACVRKIINEIFLDGQLDECEITLKDLNKIEITFNAILNGIFHSRIDYPADTVYEKEGRKGLESSDRIKKEMQRGSNGESKKKSNVDSRTDALN